MAKAGKSRGAKLVGVVAFLVVFVVLLMMCTADRDGLPVESDTSTSARAEPAEEGPAGAYTSDAVYTESAEERRGGSVGETVEAWVAAKSFVEEQLVAPATAKFNGVAKEPWVIYLGGARYRVSASVDSQNSFGAMLRTEFVAVVRAKRDEHQTWVLESLEF